MENEMAQRSPWTQTIIKLLVMALITTAVGFGAHASGIAPTPLSVVSICTFISVICTTIFFWTHRVAAAFLGVAVLIMTRAMTLRGILHSTELDIILFLIGMMIIIGALKDLGFLTWIIQTIINKKKMTGISFTLILCGLAALLSSVVDEVSSIVVILALVFQVCDTLKVRATPFVIMAVMATNIGSSSTMLGNPVGIFIGNKAGFTFSQFLCAATPISFTALVATIFVLLFIFKKPIHEMSQKMEEHRTQNQGLGPMVRIPYKRGLFVLIATVTIIAFHHQIEGLLGLTGDPVNNKNALLIITPLIVAGILMACRPKRARYYVEHDVEWWTLLFFMLLFAIAGSLKETGVTENLARVLSEHVTGGHKAMVPFVLGISSIGSAFVDNIVFVAAFTPVIESLVANISADYNILWWALLFGACFGGNITLIGSTANIVALGMLEKRSHCNISFVEWLKTGAIVGLVTALIAWGLLMVIPTPMPINPPQREPAPQAQAPAQGQAAPAAPAK